jgi:ferredoxin/flavodoxin---NADP+ reductase
MTYVITQPCCNDASCVPACPVNCIHPTPDEPDYGTAEMLYIDPVGCIDCGACVSVCPVSAIVADYELEPELAPFEQLNALYFEAPGRRDYDPHPLDSPRANWTGSGLEPLRVAVVGSGPAGLYLAEELLSQRGLDVSVDMFERELVPMGLVRFGVAPDHQHTKAVSDGFARTMRRPGFRLFLGVDVGRALTHDDLASRYHAVVYAVGADGDRRLGIPGEDLPGSHAAADFVAWYNGHPGHAGASFDLSRSRAVVIGNGNVALDVARVLLTPAAELARTDIAPHALEALERSSVREVVVVGRRGPAQAAFTTPELLGLQLHDGFDVALDRSFGDVDTSLGADDPVATYKASLVSGLPEPTGTDRGLVLRFHASPVEILGEARVEGIRLARNALTFVDGRARSLATDETADLACGLVLRSVGYVSSELPGVPFHPEHGTIPNASGRVTDELGHAAVPGLYVTGWVKRGPSGVIGTNRHDAVETANALLEDHRLGRLPKNQVDGDVAGLVPDALGHDAWLRIDSWERSAGRNASPSRPRTKLVDRSELHGVATGATETATA